MDCNWEKQLDGLKILLSWTLVLAPMIVAGRMLHQLDVAAKKRKAPVKVWLVDFFTLLFLVQLPLAFVVKNLGINVRGRAAVAVGLCLVAMLVWWGTVKTISGAGITKVFWRSAISLFAFPMAYLGSFALSINGVHLVNQRAHDPNYNTVWAIEIGLVILLALSFFLVIQGIHVAQESAENVAR